MKFFLLLLISFPFYGFSAEPDYRIQLKSGTYYPDAGLMETDTDDAVAGRYYRVVQFYDIPTLAEREKMENAGLRFLEYIPNYVYFLSVPTSANLQNVLPPNKVRAFFKAPVEFKLHPAIASGDFPGHMVTPEGEIIIQVACFEQEMVRSVYPVLAGLGKLSVSAHNPKVLVLQTRHQNLLKIALTPGVQYIEPVDPAAEPENLPGRTNHRSNAIATDYAMGRHYDGSGVLVAMGDDGIIGPHIDYEGRIDQSNVTSNNGNHGDHVAGTIMGAGNLNPTAKGMAFGSDLYVYSVWDAINNTPSSYISPGIRITSTSYSNGCNAGYTSFAQTADEHVYQMPSLMHVFSSGNNGTSDCQYGAGAGWGNVTGGVKIGKNVIAVANLNTNDVLASSSSRGPAHDGRIKPDVSAVGTSVNSTIDVNSYDVFSGTSMACPGTSGTMAQLYQAYKETNGGMEPDAGLMKGILMNTADDIGNAGPDFKHGYGRINGLRAAQVIEAGNHITDSLLNSAQNIHSIVVPPNTAEIKIMVYWTDYKGSVNASKALVNDLDLTVTDPALGTWNPWVLDPTPNATALNSPATRSVDTLNNMEQVTLSNPVAGTYLVTVNGTLVPQGPQKYYLTWEIMDDSITVTYPIGGESFVPGESERLRWDAAGNTGNFTIEYTVNNGSTWNTITSTATGSSRGYNWTVPTSLTGQAKIRVSRGGYSDQSDANFSIMPVPTGLTVNWACPDSINLTWNAVSQATFYEVSMLGAKYMDSAGVSNTNSITLHNTNANIEYWFSVKAHGPTGAIGRRAFAINKAPGTFSCPVPFDAALTTLSSPGSFLQECLVTGQVPVSVTVSNNGTSSLSNIPIAYSLNGGTVVNASVAGPLAAGSTTTFTFPAGISLNTGTNTLTTWVQYGGDGNGYNDSLTTTITVNPATAVTTGWDENFETFSPCPTTSNCDQTNCTMINGLANGPNNDVDNIDWRTDNGGTPSTGTGPSMDDNPGSTSGKYVYLEASNGCSGQTAELYLPCFDLTGAFTPQFGFSYHMYGSAMGQLYVDIYSDNTWTNNITGPFSGNQGDVWKTGNVDLTPYVGKTVMIRFRGVTGFDWASDMALDNFSLIETTNPGVQEQSLNSGLAIYPNPNDGASLNVLFRNTGFRGEISILDVTGRVIKSQKASASQNEAIQINLSNLAAGSYWIRTVDTNGTRKVSSLVVK